SGSTCDWITHRGSPGQSKASVEVSGLSRSHPGFMAYTGNSRWDRGTGDRNLPPRSRESTAERGPFGDAGLLHVHASVLARHDGGLDTRPVRSRLVNSLKKRCSAGTLPLT